jgi:hypothetical protein
VSPAREALDGHAAAVRRPRRDLGEHRARCHRLALVVDAALASRAGAPAGHATRLDERAAVARARAQLHELPGGCRTLPLIVGAPAAR